MNLYQPLSARQYFVRSILLLAVVWNGMRFTLFGPGSFRVIPDNPMGAALAALVVAFAGAFWMYFGFRRLWTLGYPRWFTLLFLMPVANVVLFILLCLDRRVTEYVSEAAPDPIESWAPWGRFTSAAASVMITGVLGTLLVCAGAMYHATYGTVLFCLVPLELGIVSSALYSWRERRSLGECIGVTMLSLAMVGCLLLLFAIEGLMCIVMAAPIATAAAIPGACAGYLMQTLFFRSASRGAGLLLMALVTPMLMGAEGKVISPSPLYSVTTTLEIDAPPEVVWRNVVAFNELPAPRGMLFSTGVAYPIRAEIHGEGVGAVRHCIFSTGPFVEPITVWDEPRRLAFNVTAQPHALEEWSPWGSITPRHLDGYFRSERGQFVLKETPSGGTLLEGTTWYRQALAPAGYWRLWSDYIIHRIHTRVLEHIGEQCG